MTDSVGNDALAHVLIANDGEVIARLRLSAAEAARVCNVTPRQLIYWTKKGLVKPSTEDDHDYDVFALEKVIRIRQALEKGYSLEKAAQVVQRDLALVGAEIARLDAMSTQELEEELRARIDRLAERLGTIKQTLPVGLGLARLRQAVAHLVRLESQGTLPANGSSGDNAKALTLRLGRAVDELEVLLRDAATA